MKTTKQLAQRDATFELKASPTLPGMANLRINCLVSIPTGIRILGMIDAEEINADKRELTTVSDDSRARMKRKG
jgi:hypothetical protein